MKNGRKIFKFLKFVYYLKKLIKIFNKDERIIIKIL
jgi:hypothetical protein